MTDVHFILANLWFLLIAVLIIGYFILDGLDLGAGALYPFLAKDEKEKTVVRKAVGPIWDGNEVWLLTAGGALFAAFAPAYATSFSGFYLAIMLVLFGLIARAAAIEFRSNDPQWAKAWDIAFFLGSLVPALLFGVAIGNVFEGIQLAPNGDYTGGFFALLNPFALLCGVLGLSQILLQGASWIALKAPQESELRSRAKKFRQVFSIVTVIVFALVTALVFLVVNPTMEGGLVEILRYVFAVLFVLGFLLQLVFSAKDKDMLAFLASCVGPVALVGIFATSVFPNIIPAAASSTGEAITIVSAASSELSLTCMTIITCIGLPFVLLSHVIVYRTFRGRIND
jgi:cytochrome d ubiquinol oxidase subunit II